jgi:restriction system protein
MAIPDFQTIMLPLLKLAGDKKEHTIQEATNKLADQFDLTEKEKRELLPSGQQETFRNRVAWSKSYLKMAGLIEATRRGCFQITQRGIGILQDGPEKINIKFLSQFEEFNVSKSRKREKAIRDKERKEEEITPEEALEKANQDLRDNLVIELLQQIKESPPVLFERIVIELLIKMGYGGSRKDAGEAIGGTGDEGIDGIIKEDRLGLDVIYIQAKRWTGTVGRPEIQKFAGALQGQRARKGVFITTSTFSQDAYNYASRIETKIVLIDGEMLANLMIDNNIGVSPAATYEIKRMDLDYFME